MVWRLHLRCLQAAWRRQPVRRRDRVSLSPSASHLRCARRFRIGAEVGPYWTTPEVGPYRTRTEVGPYWTDTEVGPYWIGAGGAEVSRYRPRVPTSPQYWATVTETVPHQRCGRRGVSLRRPALTVPRRICYDSPCQSILILYAMRSFCASHGCQAARIGPDSTHMGGATCTDG
jgi:hypothetical protein